MNLGLPILAVLFHARVGLPFASLFISRNHFGQTHSGCEWAVPLLKFDVCWDTAVCAVSAGGFFCVLNGVRKANVSDGVRKTNDWRPSYWPDPLELFRV